MGFLARNQILLQHYFFKQHWMACGEHSLVSDSYVPESRAWLTLSSVADCQLFQLLELI
jgi:hypothetical protein